MTAWHDDTGDSGHTGSESCIYGSNGTYTTGRAGPPPSPPSLKPPKIKTPLTHGKYGTVDGSCTKLALQRVL